MSRNIISTRLPLPAVAIPPWLKHGLLRKDISRKIIYLFLHRCLISRREDFFLIDRGISSIGRKKFTERKIVRRKGEQHVLSGSRAFPYASCKYRATGIRRNPRALCTHAECAGPIWRVRDLLELSRPDTLETPNFAHFLFRSHTLSRTRRLFITGIVIQITWQLACAKLIKRKPGE